MAITIHIARIVARTLGPPARMRKSYAGQQEPEPPEGADMIRRRMEWFYQIRVRILCNQSPSLRTQAIGPTCPGGQSFPSLVREELPTTRVMRSGWSKIFSCFGNRNLY
jgi:hypothetical protein